MSKCIKCGKYLPGWAKFCPRCGMSVGKAIEKEQNKGLKCPNCGETLKAFEAKCSACGYELRKTQTAAAVQEFAKEISRLESEREKQQRSIQYRLFGSKDGKIPMEKSIANMVRNFVVPNTKEDIFEFMLLVSANVSAEVENADRIIADAWNEKMEQIYEKAKITFGNGPEFNQIKEIYDKKKEALRTQKMKKWIWRVVGIGFFVILAFVGLFLEQYH